MHYRFVIDDDTECKTQRAVLLAFANALSERRVGDVLLSSNIVNDYLLVGAPINGSVRLSHRLACLTPSVERQRTVFFPAHIVPKKELGFWSSPPLLSDRRVVPMISCLDMFEVDNSSEELLEFSRFMKVESAYDSVSSYNRFSSASISVSPLNVFAASAIKCRMRPWYFRGVALENDWFYWCKMAIDTGCLGMADLKEDVRAGRIRPSLHADVASLSSRMRVLLENGDPADELFVFPERRVSIAQRQLLISGQISSPFKKNKKRKSVSLVSLIKDSISDLKKVFLKRDKLNRKNFSAGFYFLLRQAIRLSVRGYHFSYAIYNSLVRQPSLRLVRKLRGMM